MISPQLYSVLTSECILPHISYLMTKPTDSGKTPCSHSDQYVFGSLLITLILSTAVGAIAVVDFTTDRAMRRLLVTF